MIFLGPVATFGSTLISEFTLMIREFSPLLAGAVVGFTWQILVIFGMHWGFIPVYINNVQTLGYDNVMMPFFRLYIRYIGSSACDVFQNKR